LKRITKAAVAALATAVSLIIPLSAASPASAAVQDCPSGYFCLWWDADFSGAMLAPSANGTAWPDFGTRSFNDVASSGRNNTGVGWCVYQDINYQGSVVYFPPNTQVSNFGWFNDMASSARVC
jgi:hypothetical protein